jgi:hypothetical protein
MAVIFSKWTIFSYGDDQTILEMSEIDSPSPEIGGSTMSDVSSLSDVPVSGLEVQNGEGGGPTMEPSSADVTSKGKSKRSKSMSIPTSPLFTPRAWFGKQQDDAKDAVESRVDKIIDLLSKQSRKNFERYSRSGSKELNKVEFMRLVENLIGESSKKEFDEVLAALGVKSGLEIITYETIAPKVVVAKMEDNASIIITGKDVSAKSANGVPMYILLPSSRIHKFMKMVRTLAALFYLVVVPYECGLIHTQGLATESLNTLKIGWCVDCILLIDIMMKFHTAYTNKTGFRIVRVAKIRKHYLSHGFIFDLICFFPADVVVYATLTTNTSKLGYFRIFRLLRCTDMISYFKMKLAKATATARLTVEIQILFAILFALLHVSACVWFALTDPLTTTTTNTYLSNYHGTFSGFGANSTSNLRLEEYMLSMYWVTGTLTTMGQGGGDLMPQNARERVFAIFLMMMNLSIYAYILGAISNLFMSADEAIVRKRSEISAVERFITSNRLSSDLEKEIRNAMSTDHSSGEGVR